MHIIYLKSVKSMCGLDLKRSQLYVAVEDGNQRLQKAKISRKWQRKFHDEIEE